MNESHCPYCKTVNLVCFWGPMPEANWKRPTLLVLAAAMLAGLVTLFMLFHAHPNNITLYLFGVPLFLAAVLGVLVAINGCSACVSRLFGDV